MSEHETTDDITSIDDPFEFEEGDRVKVKAENDNGRIEFIGECRKIETFPTGRTQATFGLPGMMNIVSFATHEAHFEAVNDV